MYDNVLVEYIDVLKGDKFKINRETVDLFKNLFECGQKPTGS
jgi:hypothetical protein